jgi:hypothetical protein
MILYFLEHTEKGEMILYKCPMNERHILWNEHPRAREISKKDYFKLQYIFDKIKNKKENDTANRQSSID